MEWKKLGISFGVDAISLFLMYLLIPIHIFLLRLHPFYKILENYTLNQFSEDPSLFQKAIEQSGIATSKALMSSAIIYIFVLVLISLLFIFLIFTLSRTILYNKLIHNKFNFKNYFKNIKITLLGIFLIQIPAIIVLIIVFFGVSTILYLISLFTNGFLLNQLIDILRLYLISLFLIIYYNFYIKSLNSKKIFYVYPKVFLILKNKAYYLISMIALIISIVFLLLQTYVLSKIPFMYIKTSIFGLPISLEILWYFGTTLFLYSFLRIKTLESFN